MGVRRSGAVVTDHPIIFSGPMVVALLAGRKTQTRRLATSPLRRCEVGDRLWVREAWSHTGDGVFEISQARMLGRGGVIYRADANPKFPHAKFWPSLRMPREFSRLTLIVEGVRVEPLQAISEDDAFDEGIEEDVWDQAPVARDYSKPDAWFVGWSMGINPPCTSVEADRVCRESYRTLWSSLHSARGQRWEDNPDALVLTFRVERGNIDQVPL